MARRVDERGQGHGGLGDEWAGWGAEGLKHPSALSLDHVQTVEKARLTGYVGSLGAEKMRDVCRALAIAVACDN